MVDGLAPSAVDGLAHLPRRADAAPWEVAVCGPVPCRLMRTSAFLHDLCPAFDHCAASDINDLALHLIYGGDPPRCVVRAARAGEFLFDGPLHSFAASAVPSTRHDLETWGYLPGAVRVQRGVHSEVLACLLELLRSIGVRVEECDELPNLGPLMSRIATECTEGVTTSRYTSGPRIPSLLKSRDVTVSRVRALADAMVAFCEAAPWQYYINEVGWDVAPTPSTPTMRSCAVTGAGGENVGLVFSRSALEYFGAWSQPSLNHKRGVNWSVLLVPLDDAPEVDLSLWIKERLPMCRMPPSLFDPATGRRLPPDQFTPTSQSGMPAIPLALGERADGTYLRPTVGQMDLMEGLLRGFASWDPNSPRGGMLELEARTSGGARRFRLYC